MFLGDIAAAALLKFTFTTVSSTGAPTALAGTPAISVYKDGGGTESTAGVTLTASFDSVTGLNLVAIDTSADGTFYSAGSNFDVVITTGTVGGTSVVGYVVGNFSISNRPVQGIGANVITATAIAANAIGASEIAAGAITNSTFAAGAIDATAIAADAIGSSELAASAVTEIQTGLSTLDAAGVRTAVGLATANLDTQLSAIDSKTTNLPASPAATGDAMTLTGAYDFAKGTVAMAESYAADGATVTPAQALYMLISMLFEANAASTTITTKKLDGATTAMTFTIDNASTPATITRAT